MRTHSLAVAIAAAAAGALAVACTVTTINGPAASDAGADASPADRDASAPPDGSSSADGAALDADDGAPPQAYVRVAHWSPDAPAIDACFAPQDGSFAARSPVLAQLLPAPDAGSRVASDAGDAGAPNPGGLAFPQVTSYLIVPPGTYAVRLVAAGSPDCSTPLVALPSVALALNTHTTIAAIGEAAPVGTDQPLALVPFADEVNAPAAQVALRFINASPSNPGLSSVEVGTGSIAGSGGAFATLFSGVLFGVAGGSPQRDAGSVDANGYLAESPLAGATLSVHATNSAHDTAVALNDVTVPGGSAATLALINGISNVSAASGAKLLLCVDADASKTSPFAACSVVSTQ